MNTITKTLHGVEVEFYTKENGKYTCRVKNDPAKTEKILQSCETKSVRADKLHFFIKGIKEKIEAGVLGNKKEEKATTRTNNNPIVELSEKVQKHFGANIETEVVKVTGKAHCPTVKVKVKLPNGEEVTAVGDNQKIAKQTACRMILDDWKALVERPF